MGKLRWYHFNYLIAEVLNLFVKPDPMFWLFSSRLNTSFDYNSRYLFEYVIKYYPNIKCRFVINNEDKRKELIDKYGEYFIETKSLKGIRGAIQAGVWLTSSGLPMYLLHSRRNRIIINLWHGTPIKTVGKCAGKPSLLWSIYFKYYFSKNIAYISTSSSKLIDIYSKSFGINKHQVKVLGKPRNDLVNTDIERKTWLSNKYSNLPLFNKILLYAPTFREYGETNFFPFPDMDYEILEEFLEKEKLIIFIRFHAAEGGIPEINKSKRIFYFNSNIVEDITSALNIFDLLITDYSSIYTDFLLTHKPLIFLPYDIDRYLSHRGLNFDYNTVTPGPKPNKLEGFIKEIKKLLDEPGYYYSDRVEMDNFFNEIKSDNCKRVTRFLIKESHNEN